MTKRIAIYLLLPVAAAVFLWIFSEHPEAEQPEETTSGVENTAEPDSSQQPPEPPAIEAVKDTEGDAEADNSTQNDSKKQTEAQ